ncbi:MAG TPA: type II secretion system F family protein, partial [Candidatus Bathyarchaeia archaeon]|nr:type II secretion system F family protein [Candidatus Bathyarchaeia archaeon]
MKRIESLTPKEGGGVDLKAFSYARLRALGSRLLGVRKGIERDLEASYLKTHPEVYLSLVSFLVILSIPVSLAAWMLSAPIFPLSFIFPLVVPLCILLVGMIYPRIMASNRASGLKSEIPYAFMYVSVMVSGGLSPYACLIRLSDVKLLPKLKDEMKRMLSIVLSTGSDPLSAMEKAAKALDLPEYKDLILGYASAVRTGGDVFHYLFTQTETMFKNLKSRLKASAENIAILMETYTIITILGSLGLYMIFVISMSVGASIGMSISPEMFFLFSFVLLPLASVVFVYFSDMVQVNYPYSNRKSYLVFLVMAPLGIFLISQMSLSFLFPELTLVQPLKDFVLMFQDGFGFVKGADSSIGLVFGFLIWALPAVITELRESRREAGVLRGVTSFLRDLVEVRKTGISPEKCIQTLSNRDYGAFSNLLKVMSLQLSLGLPLRKIYESFSDKVKNWLSAINIYLLIDTLEIGGGQEQSLETLANFAEETKMIDTERRASL